MHQNYSDISDRINEPPLWYDEHGVPRYDPFHPSRAASIYIAECALIEIECQECGRQFFMAASQINVRIPRILGWTADTTFDLAKLIRLDMLHCGDPPNIGCCAAGYTMTSVPRQVLQYWRRGTKPNEPAWQRNHQLEIAFREPIAQSDGS